MSALGVNETWVMWGILAIMLGGALFAPMQGRGQDVDPEVRQRALEDYHGPDLEGKDGPMAKAGLDLTLLYHEWKAHQEQNGEGDFTASQSSLPVQNGRVTVDVTAVQDAAALQQELEELGLENGARAGRMVSGRLPIEAIPDAAALADLQAMRPARAMTHSGVQPAAPETAAVDEDSDSTVWYVVGGAVLVVGGLLFWGLRR